MPVCPQVYNAIGKLKIEAKNMQRLKSFQAIVLLGFIISFRSGKLDILDRRIDCTDSYLGEQYF